MPTTRTADAYCGDPKILTRDSLQKWLETHALEMETVSPEEPCGTSAWWIPYLNHVTETNARFAWIRPESASPPLILQMHPRGLASSVSNYYTALFRPLPIDRNTHSILESIGKYRGLISALRLEPLSESDAKHWQEILSTQGWKVFLEPAFINWYLPCTDLTFQRYVDTRSAQLKNTWKRKKKKFDDHPAGSHIEIIRDLADVDRGMDAFEKIYARSWKPTESHPAFIRAWARECARRGWLRLGIAWIGSIPIASQFWYTVGGKSNIFKLAYDNDYQQFSAGTLLSFALFEHSLDVDQVAEIDYISGNDPYKQSWVSQQRTRMRLLAFDTKAPWGYLRHLRHLMAAERRRLLPRKTPSERAVPDAE